MVPSVLGPNTTPLASVSVVWPSVSRVVRSTCLGVEVTGGVKPKAIAVRAAAPFAVASGDEVTGCDWQSALMPGISIWRPVIFKRA